MQENLHREFLDLYNTNRESIEKYALNLSYSKEIAKELIAEAIFVAFSNFNKINERQAFLSYVFTIIRRNFYSNIYKKKNYSIDSEIDPDILFSNSLSPEDKTDISILYEALAKLDEEKREVIILAEINGLSHKEIADIQNISVANVKVRIFRAKKELQFLLTESENQRKTHKVQQ